VAPDLDKKMGDRDQWLIFLSLNETDHNYKIHNKEMLVIRKLEA